MVMDNADRTRTACQSSVHTVATRRTQRQMHLAWSQSRCMIYEYSEHRPARAITCVTL